MARTIKRCSVNITTEPETPVSSISVRALSQGDAVELEGFVEPKWPAPRNRQRKRC